jgi:hypothetical protein
VPDIDIWPNIISKNYVSPYFPGLVVARIKQVENMEKMLMTKKLLIKFQFCLGGSGKFEGV